MKTSVITGISGQGGAYLAKCLLDNGHRVVGTTRDTSRTDKHSLQQQGIENRVEIAVLDPRNCVAIDDFLQAIKPAEIYHLSAPSSVAQSFICPTDAYRDTALSTVNLLEAVRACDQSIRCFLAASTEIFGNCHSPANVQSQHNPNSPYAVAKSSVHQQARIYRQAYGMYVCSGIFSNFESPNRGPNYVTAKIVNAACDIALGRANEIKLGNLSIRRDWGAAEDFMRAAWLTLQQDQPDDYLIATGVTISLEKFLELAFSCFGLDYNEHAVVENALLRPLDINQTLCDPSVTEEKLNWHAEKNIKQVITEMVLAALTKRLGESKAQEMLDTQKGNR